jgi:uncharacterized protein (TIGR02271 family)
MAQTVIGLFDTASEAEKAVAELVSSGFSRSNIDVSTPSTYSGTTGTTSGDTYTGSGSSSTYAGSTSSDSTFGTSSAHEGTGSGIGNFFRSLFGNDDEADRYSGVAQKSNSVVTVHAQSATEAQQAADILDDNGAVDVDEKATQYGYGSTNTANSDLSSSATGSSSSATGSSLTNDTTAQGATSIPIIEEELQVGKRSVQTGGARLRSRIVERPVEESLRLREERVTVERTPVDRVATDADFASFKEGTIELTEHAEVPVVSKEARVVEEVSLGKEVEEREHTIHDTVRKTEVDIENLEKDTLRNTTTGTGNLTNSGDSFNTSSGSGSL